MRVRCKLHTLTYDLMLVFGSIIKAAGGWDAIKAGKADSAALQAIAGRIASKPRKRKADNEQLSLTL